VALNPPSAPLARWPDHLLDAAPLYAGETLTRTRDIRPAAELVRELAAERSQLS